MVVTTSSFTSGAVSEAAALGVVLVDWQGFQARLSDLMH
jgi:hypothetical protein